MYIPCSLSLQLRLFLLPSLCLPCCTFYGTVFAMSLSGTPVSPFVLGGSVVFRAWIFTSTSDWRLKFRLLPDKMFGRHVVFRAWIFTSTSDWRLKFRLLPDKMFGRHGTHPTLVQKGAVPLLQVSCVCRVVGFGV